MRADSLPPCLPPIVEANAHVANAGESGTIILRDRRVVKVEGLLWPGSDGQNSAAATQREGIALLRKLSGTAGIALRARNPAFDRYGRIRAQIVSPHDGWFQRIMVQRGLARVSIAPDRPECAQELYAAEEDARNKGIGLWSNPAYAVRTTETLHWSDLGTFQIVVGKILNAKVSGGRGYLNFGRDWRTDFTAMIAPEDMKRFKAAAIDPYTYIGKNVRVRGWIDRMNGFEIAVSSPDQIELVKPP